MTETGHPEAARRRPASSSPSRIVVPDHVVYVLDQHQVRAEVTFTEYFHGSRGAVHGGAIALIFDELLGKMSIQGGVKRSRTAYLNINYRALTPIGQPLELIGWLDRREGRKAFLEGELRSGPELLADASALFVNLHPWQETDR